MFDLNGAINALNEEILKIKKPSFSVSACGQAILFMNDPIVASSNNIFSDGRYISDIGIKALNTARHSNILSSLAHNAIMNYYPNKSRPYNSLVIEQALNNIDTKYKDILLEKYGSLDKIDEYLGYQIDSFMMKYAIEHSDEAAIDKWFMKVFDQYHDFRSIVILGLKNENFESNSQFFELLECKDSLMEFIRKYPHATPLIRCIWEAHSTAPSRKILKTISSIEELESGQFIVEIYDQNSSFYEYADHAQKFLCDAKSWNWLINQKKNIISAVMKQYCVNDKVKSKYAYHSFGRVRELLVFISDYNLDSKVALTLLKNNMGDSIDFDRFCICINNSSRLKRPEFHHGIKQSARWKEIIEYFKFKNFSTDDMVAFFKANKSRLIYCQLN